MQNVLDELEYNKKIAFSYIGIFFCFTDFFYGLIYFLISRNHMLIFINLVMILTIDILKNIFEIFFFSNESNTKLLIIFILSSSQFYIIIDFIYKILSNLDFGKFEKIFHKFFSTSVLGIIIFPYEQIMNSSSTFHTIKFCLMIMIICYLNYFIRKRIMEFISSVYDKIGDNLFLLGILYNIPFLIYFGAFGSCIFELLKIFQIDELYISYSIFGMILCKELIKNGAFIFLSGILYLYIIDVEVKNVNKPIEKKLKKCELVNFI